MKSISNTTIAIAREDFQVFAKPTGSVCNLACGYCYYLEKEKLYPETRSFTMPDGVLETFISHLIRATNDPEIRFSWHGGEPTVMGVRYFEKIVAFQKKHNTSNRVIVNNIQTNGALIDEAWCEFLSREKFTVGLSLDGPEELHDRCRLTKGGMPTHKKVLRAWELLTRHNIATDILCAVHADNVRHPLEVYRFFKDIKARYIGFLPIVNKDDHSLTGVTEYTVPAKAFGEFLCAVFDEWKAYDIGKILIQIFEEVARTALGQDHSLCIFRKTCGNFPVVEHNGDFYACDHFVQPDHLMGNIMDTPLLSMVESRPQQAFGQSKRNLLPRACKRCDVLGFCNGGCLKDRFIESGNGDKKANYLCEGYKLFFSHCRPFVNALNQRYRKQLQAQKGRSETLSSEKTGRNDPCPCGSGEKYKKCCLKK